MPILKQIPLYIKICIIFFCLAHFLFEKQALSAVTDGELYVPLDIGVGFNSTWFPSKSFQTDVFSEIEKKGDVVLRIDHKEQSSYQWIDHVPIFITSGNHTVSFHFAYSKFPNNHKIEIDLIKMKCDQNGNFPDIISKTFITKNYTNNICSVNLDIVSSGFYIIRLKSNSSPGDFQLDIYNFQIYPFGSEPKERIVQIAPRIENVVYNLGEQIQIGANVYLEQDQDYTLSCEITSIDGTSIKQFNLGNFSKAGSYSPSIIFVPKDYDFYIVSYYLEGKEDRFIQKAFSVLPEGDCSFMGLHAYSHKRNKQHLELGRKLGFVHYRDHDLGNFTRWSVVQPCKTNNCELADPPPFNWDNDDSVRYIVENLGYNYLGVLYDAPLWAKDYVRSIPSQNRYMPLIEPWRTYVRTTMLHYSDLIHDWEIWNEGKGVSGILLNDPTLYIELLKAALEEANTLKQSNPDIKLNIVAFSGFDSEDYWKKTFNSVSGFNVVSSHVKAKTYQDTYYTAVRPDREYREKYCRDGWLKTAQRIVGKNGNSQELWDTEGGMLNQVYSAYSFFNLPGENFKYGVTIADRTSDALYKTGDAKSFSPISPLISSAIMAKQTIAHKSSGITRCYMYYFSNRNFVSNQYAEQMLEYDSTLMPYTHAFIFCSKFLDKAKYISRSFLPETNVVKETFLSENEKVIEVLWNEGIGEATIQRENDKSYFTMMGRKILSDTIPINEYPIYILYSQLQVNKIKDFTLMQ